MSDNILIKSNPTIWSNPVLGYNSVAVDVSGQKKVYKPVEVLSNGDVVSIPRLGSVLRCEECLENRDVIVLQVAQTQDNFNDKVYHEDNMNVGVNKKQKRQKLEGKAIEQKNTILHEAQRESTPDEYYCFTGCW